TLEDLEPLAVGGEEPVLDAVVHHLHEVPGAARADVRVSALRGERGEDRFRVIERLAFPAHHEAVPVLETPDAARSAAVEEPNAVLGKVLASSLGVAEVRVAAVE